MRLPSGGRRRDTSPAARFVRAVAIAVIVCGRSRRSARRGHEPVDPGATSSGPGPLAAPPCDLDAYSSLLGGTGSPRGRHRLGERRFAHAMWNSVSIALMSTLAILSSRSARATRSPA